MFIETLKIVIYILLVLLLIVGIILGIKLISVLNNAQEVVDDAKKKLESLDTLFNIVDATSNKVSQVYTKAADICIGVVNKLLSKKGGKDDEEEYE